MLDLAAEILAQTSARQPCRCDDLARRRLRFSRLVNTHCEEEGTTIREAVVAGAICPRVAAALHRDLQRWRAALASFNSAWPSARVQHEQSGFASAFRPLLDDLRRYIVREECEILDRLQPIS